MAACISPITVMKYGAKMVVPCGKCNYCAQNRRDDWTFRIREELKVSQTAIFLTLTYDEQNQPTVLDTETGELIGTLNKKHVQDFFKKLRFHNDKEAVPVNPYELTPSKWPSIKYYTVGEYGGETFRPHYHSILFNVKPETANRIPEIWGKGYAVAGTVEPASIHYVTKYVFNKNIGFEPLASPFSLISQGIGRNYLNTNGHQHKEALKTTVFNDLGQQRLPRYYKDKIFSYTEKDTLRKLGLESNDLQYRKTVLINQKFHPEPETYMEYKNRQRHDNLIKQDKNKYSPYTL